MSENELNVLDIYPKYKKGGCYQWTYCNECMIHPMGIRCKKEERKEFKMSEVK